MTKRFRTIAVFGGGLTGLSAAAAFARALPDARIELIDTPPDPGALADRMTGTMPSIRVFNARIGLSEEDMIRRAGANYRLGVRFEHWSASGAPWVHAYGRYGPSDDGSFHQHWLAARETGDTTPLDAHHPGAALALVERFTSPSDDRASPLAEFDTMFTIDVAGYAAGLTGLLRHLGGTLSPGTVAGIERGEDGAVVAVALADGRRIEADLFIDCTGPAATLLSAIDPAFEDWSALLPCDRLLLAQGDPAVSLMESVVALPCGWRWRAPGRGGSSIGLAYASKFTPGNEAARIFRRETALTPTETVAIRPGRRPRSWIGNIVAFGDAAIAVDPLEATNLHLAQSAILRALDLLPDRTCPPPLLDEYNRRTGDATGRVRDFLAAHYCRSGRREGELWRATAKAPLPDSLARTLALFEARGRLPHFEDESFDLDDWVAILLGMGVKPRLVDPRAAGLPESERAALLRHSSQRIAAAIERVPPYRDGLAHIIGRG
jgi:tryptophan halogenase